MIKITNGVETFEVSKGAFAEIYSLQGFTIEEDVTTKSKKEKVPDYVKTKEEEDAEITALLEKPIAQWNKAEIKKFCEINVIDLSGTTNAGEAKEIIKAFLDEKAKQ